MLHAQPMRRPVRGLRKPSSTKINKSLTKPATAPRIIIVNQELLIKLLVLVTEQQDVLKKEILTSLNDGLITPTECLYLFLNTAWKDRNRRPIIAEVFHKVTQETDKDFASLIDTCINNLLHALTVLGQPNTNDLSMVTLLANLYNIEGLPDDHKNGLEMYLIDIAKAFWPYFMPEKNSGIWNDDICDSVCDVLMSVGKTLDEKCPINMERTFNNITVMMFSSSWITSYTLLRFMELKEVRAANWALTNTAKSYYNTAYSKHDRSSYASTSSDSPVSQSSLDGDDDVFKSSTVATSTSTSCSKEIALNDPNYQVTITKGVIESQSSGQILVRVLELVCNLEKEEPVKESDGDELDDCMQSYYCEGTKCNQPQSNCQSPKSSNGTCSKVQDPRSCIPENFKTCQPKPCFDTTDDFPVKSRNNFGGFPSPTLSCPEPQCNNNHGSQLSGGFGFTGQPRSNCYRDGFPRPGNHTFHRTLSQNDSSCVSGFTGQLRPEGFPENDTLQGVCRKTRSIFHRTLSENDGTNSKLDGGFPKFLRRNSHEGHHWRSMLEFPVQKVVEQDCDKNSRLYLLSFATQPPSLERPSELTLTAELVEEKPWLKDVILPQPVTVVERFG